MIPSQKDKIQLSVIIPLFNSSEWIRECIDSVIRQMDAVNLEIIVVDDQSSDNSVEIVQSYCDRYQNIKLYCQTHGHQGKARNTGMQKATGEYIVFLDADDVLQAGALKSFLSQAVSDQCEFIVGIAQSFNEKTTWVNESYQIYTAKQSNTDIDHFSEFLLDPSACNKIFKASFLKTKDIKFPENTYCEDVGFIYTTYLLANKISILPQILHRYRGRPSTSPLSGTRTFTEERVSQCAEVYSMCLDQYRKTGKQKINDLFQARAIIRIQRFFNRMNKIYPDSTSYLYETLMAFFLRISPQIISQNGGRFAIPFFMIRQGKFPHAVALMKSPDNKTALCDFFCLLAAEDPELSSLFFKDFIIYPPQPQGNQDLISKKKFLSSVPGIVGKIFSSTARPELRKLIRLKITLVRDHLWGLCLLIWFSIAGRILNQKIWLIGERNGTGAEENGYIFFKYCRDHRKCKNVYYMVEKAFFHDRKFYNEKNILIKGSFKHLFFSGFTKYIIFNNDIWDIFPRITQSWLPDIKKIFLTHGLKLYNPGVYMRNRANFFNATIVSSELEKQTVKYEWNIINPSKLIVTGLPRFDNLWDAKPAKEILFCPTWRKSLASLDREQFLNSPFYSEVSQLLADPRLLKFLDDQEMTLVFRIHFNLEKYISCFQNALSHRIRIEYESNSRNLQHAIRGARLLITDYSSILWDIAYLHRPVILYHFDREAFLAERGLHAFGIDESQMTFIRVAKSRDTVIDHLEQIADTGFVLSPDEADNADSFFAYRDGNNCERLYNYLS